MLDAVPHRLGDVGRLNVLSLYTRYIEAVREALWEEPNAWRFKSDARYREVLEHTPLAFAVAMLEWSLRAMPGLEREHVRALCRLNDSVGAPVLEQIFGLGNYAPSNMRYLCHAIKLWQHIDSLGLPRVEIVEIGGGFGGLTTFVRGLAELFDTQIGAYWDLDLPEVATLQYRVARELGVSVFPLEGDDPASLKVIAERTKPLICFSAYAFSEFDQATRDWYAERVLQHCRHGLMIWNFPIAGLKDENGVEFGGPPYPFVEWPITRVPDEPRLYDGHEMVTW